MSLKKTLFLTEYYPPLVGGSCSMFAWRFSLYPPDRIVVLTKTVEHAREYDKELRYPIKRIPLERKGPKGFEWLGIVWGLLKAGIPLARQHRIEVIQCARPFPEGFAGYLIAALLRKKLVLNAHGDDIAMYQNYMVERVLMKRVLRAAQLHLANSNFTALLIKRYGGEEDRIRVIHPGFDPESLRMADAQKVAQLRTRLGGQPILLTVGRLQRRKGQDFVIRAIPKILSLFPDLKYVIVGPLYGWPPGYADTLRDLIKQLGIDKHVIMAGTVAEAELALYYEACDLFVMPNRLVPPGDVEGFGIVFLEAGFLGKPVIGGNSGGVPDAVLDGETGLLVDGYFVGEIAQNIITLLSNPQLASEMGERGREFAQSMTYHKMFEQYQELMIQQGL